MAELKIEDITISAEMDLTDGKEIYKETTNNYEELRNLPTLNGEVIIGDMQEKDPTVQAVSLEELAGLFN